jgi:hypothetical protein
MAYKKSNPNGQATMANSEPVVIASDQSAVPVSATSLPLPTGAATEATLATRLTESDFDTKIGSLTETAPGTDTASSGLNGRLQRIAQRLTSLITAIGSPFQAGGSIGNTSFGATQSGTWSTRTQDGSGNNTTSHSAGSSRGLDVSIIDGSGNQITSFGGGTQYTEGDTDSTITGTAMMWEDTSDTLRAVSAAKPLPVSVSSAVVAGDVAHDSADSGNPVKVGGKAKNYGSLPTAVTDADRANFLTDRYGAHFVTNLSVSMDSV